MAMINNEIKKQINIGYGLLLFIACLFVVQVYLSLKGHIVSYGGAAVVLICGFSVLRDIKKLEGKQ